MNFALVHFHFFYEFYCPAALHSEPPLRVELYAVHLVAPDSHVPPRRRPPLRVVVAGPAPPPGFGAVPPGLCFFFQEGGGFGPEALRVCFVPFHFFSGEPLKPTKYFYKSITAESNNLASNTPTSWICDMPETSK